jgi:hypothetical protein
VPAVRRAASEDVLGTACDGAGRRGMLWSSSSRGYESRLRCCRARTYKSGWKQASLKYFIF